MIATTWFILLDQVYIFIDLYQKYHCEKETTISLFNKNTRGKREMCLNTKSFQFNSVKHITMLSLPSPSVLVPRGQIISLRVHLVADLYFDLSTKLLTDSELFTVTV